MGAPRRSSRPGKRGRREGYELVDAGVELLDHDLVSDDEPELLLDPLSDDDDLPSDDDDLPSDDDDVDLLSEDDDDDDDSDFDPEPLRLSVL
jgi:hypothetical protein